MSALAKFAIIKDPKKPMNPVFPKLPRSYAVDAVWSRFFLKKKSGTGANG
jgi:hypothetical protein